MPVLVQISPKTWMVNLLSVICGLDYVLSFYAAREFYSNFFLPENMTPLNYI